MTVGRASRVFLLALVVAVCVPLAAMLVAHAQPGGGTADGPAAGTADGTAAGPAGPRRFERLRDKGIAAEWKDRIRIDASTKERLVKKDASAPPVKWNEIPIAVRDQSVDWSIRKFRDDPSALRVDAGAGLAPEDVAVARRIDPFIHAEGNVAIGKRIGSVALQRSAVKLAAANQAYLQLIEAPAGKQPPKDTLAKNSIVCDTVGFQMASELSVNFDKLTRQPPADAALREAAERKLEEARQAVLRLLGRADVMDHRSFDDLRMVSPRVLRQIADNCGVVVAIRWDDGGAGGGGPYRFLGTGFVYRGHVVTCAHLFTTEWRDNRVDFSRVVVHPYDRAAEHFDLDAAARVRGEGSKVFPTADSACLELAPGAARDAIVASAAAAAVDFPDSPSLLEIGAVYGLTAMRGDGGKVDARWIPTGRILFPPELKLPPRSRADAAFTCGTVDVGGFAEGAVDRTFLRVLRIQLFAEYFGTGRSDGLCSALQRIGESYAPGESPPPPAGAGATIFRLYFGTDASSRLADFAEDAAFKQSRRLPCFGTDLLSEGGASGAPVFRLSDDARAMVVGVNLGTVGSASGNPEAPSLSQCTRTMPFYSVKRVVDPFIAGKAAPPP